MEEQTIFSWIHLADIHVGHGDKSHGWNQALVMDALRRDVASRPGPDLVNWILLTGDVAAGGSPDEYAQAAAWLRDLAAAAQVDPRWIFVVPGDHDVNRAADGERQLGRLLDGLRSGREPIDTALADASDRAQLAERVGAYLDFASGFAPWCLEEGIPAPAHRLFWMRRIRLMESFRVRLVGLNTALLGGDDGDRGKLQLGAAQLAAALNPPVEDVGELVIAMSHHPLAGGWLADQSAALDWVDRHAHVHLSGHAHEAEPGSGGRFVRVVAGAVRDDETTDGAPTSHGYNFCEVVHTGGGALELRVWPRRWSEANGEFRADVGRVPPENLSSGRLYASHRLRARLPVAMEESPAATPEPPATPTQAPSPVTTADVFYVYAPEDAAMIEGLDTHLSLLKKTEIIQSFDSRSIALDAEQALIVAAHVRSAPVFLVMVSPAFLVSDFFFGPLMDRLLDRAAHGAAFVVPIYLEPCDWQSTKIAELEGLPRDGTPVSNIDRDTAFADIAFELRHLFRPSKKRR